MENGGIARRQALELMRVATVAPRESRDAGNRPLCIVWGSGANAYGDASRIPFVFRGRTWGGTN